MVLSLPRKGIVLPRSIPEEYRPTSLAEKEKRVREVLLNWFEGRNYSIPDIINFFLEYFVSPSDIDALLHWYEGELVVDATKRLMKAIAQLDPQEEGKQKGRELYEYLQANPMGLEVVIYHGGTPATRWHPAEPDEDYVYLDVKPEYDENAGDLNLNMYDGKTEVTSAHVFYIAPGELEIDNPGWYLEFDGERIYPHTLSAEEFAAEVEYFLMDALPDELGTEYLERKYGP
jgi:hypothetical protein